MGRRRGNETPTKKDQSLLTSSPTLDLYYNDFLTLSGIPAGVYDYRLGNRGALERVINPFRVTRDEQGHIAGDPNRIDDEEYPVRLPGQVITVRLETLKVVKALPAL